MTTTLTIDQKSYVPVKDAGSRFGYTEAYILMLIKQGKLDAQKVGRKWYIHLAAAENFFKQAKQDRELNRKQISQVRKTELRQHTQKRTQTHKHRALVETMALLIIGLSLGVTGYLGTNVATQTATVNNTNFLENFAISLYSFFTPEQSAQVAQAILPENNTSTTTNNSFIIAPAIDFTATDAAAIQDSFSDPVTVTLDPENTDTGIITPIFKDGKQGTEYRFLMVPVNTQ